MTRRPSLRERSVSSNTPPSSDCSYLAEEIAAASLQPNAEERVQNGLAILDAAMAKLDTVHGHDEVHPQGEHVIEIDADDLFELVSMVMGLADSAARRIGLSGLVGAVQADDFDEFQINCLAVQRFCVWAVPPSIAAH